jgi:death-on-curing family protein
MWIPKRELIERIHEHILARLGGERGPLNPNNLEASIERAKTVVYGHEPFKDVIAKATALAYAIISWGHPFLDGNKRTGIATLFAMLEANDISIAVPPYIIKYAVEAALPPENKHHIEQEEFTSKIAKLCYTRGSNISYWKRLRYDLYPRALLRSYLWLLGRFPNWKTVQKAVGMRIFDWFAANDVVTMNATVAQWKRNAEQGYPKDVPALSIKPEDFEEITPPPSANS